MAKSYFNLQCARCVLLAGTALALVPGTAAFAADSSNTGLETIIVTAQKRAENLQVVPVAVTAITTKQLEAIRFENIRDLDAIAPGVSLREGAGGGQTQQFTMRGVYGQNTFASDSGVAMYVDGVYVASTLGNEFDLADVERIEVLRGPQGTLFGRNSIGGAVNIITKEPSGEFHARQQFAAGNLNQFRSKTTIDLPAWGILSASVTFLHDQRDGDVKNLGGGTVWHYGPSTFGQYGDLVSPATLGGHDTNAVTAAAKLETESGIKAVYRFNYTHKDFSPDAVGLIGFPADGGAFGALLNGVYLTQPAATRTPISHTRPAAVNNWFSTEALQRVESHTLTVTAPVMDGVTVKDLFGYRHNYGETTNQLTGLGGQYTSDLAPFGLDFYPAGTPFLALENASETDQKTISNEVSANIDTRWIKSTLGYLYYMSKGNEGGLGHSLNGIDFAGLATPGWIGFTEPPTLSPYIPEHALIRTISHAVYNQDEVHITHKLDFVGGFRYTKDIRHGLDSSPTPAAAPTIVNYDKGQWTYLAGVNYKVSDDIFLYAKYSTGYISGGQLANLVFQPETAKSWEAGFKGDLFEKTLRLNADVFTVRYGSVQTLTSPLVANGGCSNLPGVSKSAGQCIINGGNGKATGFELEGTYVTPIEGLTFAGNLAYNDFHYTSVIPSLRSPIDGTFVPQDSPRWTSDISAQYRGPDSEALGGAHVMARIEGNFTSSAWAQSNSAMVDLIAAQIPSRWLLNGTLGLGGFKVAGATVDIDVYGKNITNNGAEAYAVMFGLVTSATYERARTFGIELNAGF